MHPITVYLCTYRSCTTGDLRLVEGIYHGRLEICWNGVWGTVCDDLWSNANSRVACRQLGFSGLGIATLFVLHVREVTGIIIAI